MADSDKLTTMEYTIRGIELDATGTVSPGWLARILEDTRWRASSLDRQSFRGLMEGGVARAGTYEYGVPLGYEDHLEIATWVTRVGRTSFDFAHRVTRTSDGAMAARARMTIVNLGPEGPAPLAPFVADYVIDEGAPEAWTWSEGERASAWTREWTVRPSDQDSFRHVNQARYVDYIDDTRWFAAKASCPSGLEGPLQKLSIEYVREAHAGERVTMATWVTGSLSRAYELTLQATGELLARGQALRGTR